MKLKQITGQHIDLDLSNPTVKAHFDNPINCTREILDEWESEPFKQFFKPEYKTVLDIGANVGLFALHVLPYIKEIICVEPYEGHNDVFNELLYNYKFYDNGEENDIIELESSALSNYTGTTRYWYEGVNSTMCRLRADGQIEVPCITLADLCKKHNLRKVDFAKVDIEGSEFQALTVETIKPVFDIIDRWLIELHPRTRESQDHFKAIFEAVGYSVNYYDFNGSIYVYK